MGGVNDPAPRRITFVTGHLSGYAMAQSTQEGEVVQVDLAHPP